MYVMNTLHLSKYYYDETNDNVQKKKSYFQFINFCGYFLLLFLNDLYRCVDIVVGPLCTMIKYIR